LRDFLPFIITGIASGAIYGLAGTGLVLTYKTSGIFNFAQGAVATAGAYIFYWMHVDNGWDWKIAFFVSVLVAGPLMGLALERMARRLALQRTAMKVVGTVGIILVVQGLGTIKYGPDRRAVEDYLPGSGKRFRLLDVNVGYDQVLVTVIAIVCVAALYAVFRFARVGVSMRAVVDDPALLAMQGTNPIRVRRTAWVIGSTFASMSGVLILPALGLEPIVLTLLVVQSFGAAAIGAFSSIPLTFLGGLLIGIGSDLSKKLVIDLGWSWLNGLPASLPFIVLFVVLLVTPKRKLLPPSTVQARPPLSYEAPPRVRIGAGVIVLAGLLIVPLVAGTKLPYFTTGMATVVLLLSLGLLVKTSGQVSLCHVTFAAVGAAAFSQLHVDHNIPWLVALVLAGLITVPIGAIVAIPAIRLSGLFLALATLGFGIMVERLFYGLDIFFTTEAEGRLMPRPSFAETDKSYYLLGLGVVVVTAVLTALVQKGRLGRVLRGMSDSPVAVSTLGLSINVTRLIVFCISAFFAAVAGVLYGCAVFAASPATPFFASFASLVLIAVLAIAPFREPWYALVAGVTAVIPGFFTGANTIYWLNALFGVFAINIALRGSHPPMPARLRAFVDRLGGRATGEEAQREIERELEQAGTIAHHEVDVAKAGLEVHNLVVRFGGLLAVNDVTLAAPISRITGLIGPNGAGKTTTFNACSGLNRPSAGRVSFHGENVSDLPPPDRARRGLGRTFQLMELCDTLTVLENVGLGRESSQAGSHVLRQIVAGRKEHRVTLAAAHEAMQLCGISHLAREQAGALSTGQRRLVELARCLAGPFDLLLLDEPSSGLDRSETEQFAEVLTTVVAQRQCGVLLVEHDMGLVMKVCSYIYVLDFGALIFEGTPADVAASPLVRAAYLGTETAGLEAEDEDALAAVVDV
jgi:ABC-type branched-subunit amino acid transport system ATPase component/branched-subunit amino acid ABC-type transport system permease component